MEGRAIRASHASQLRLLDLQAVDSNIQHARHRRSTLPELGEAAAVKKRLATLDDQLIAVNTQVADLELAQSKAEADLVPVRERRVRNQERIDSGSVSDGSTLSGLIAEVEHLGRRITELEDAELEVMEELESAQQRRADLTAEREAAHQEMAEVVKRGRAAMAAIDTEIADFDSERSLIAADIGADLLDRYTKLSAKYSGVGAAALEQRRCTGCQLPLDAATVAAFATAHVDEVLSCEQCGRILVRTQRSGLS